MAAVGYIMITAGFLAGALAAVLEKDSVAWSYLGPAMAAGVAGVALAWWSSRRRRLEPGALKENIDRLAASLERLRASIRDLRRLSGTRDVGSVPIEIDERLARDLETFVEGRGSIAHRHGIQAYADVMAHFAAGERYVNRAWCAAADDYAGEAWRSLERAQEELDEAGRLLSAVRGGG